MSVNYKPLRHLMVERNIKKTELAEMVGISLPTLSKLSKDKVVTLDVIDKLCTVLDVPIEQVMRHEKDQ